MRPLISGRTTGFSSSFTRGSSLMMVKIFSAEAMEDCRVENCSASSWIGSKKDWIYCAKIYSVPIEIVPFSTSLLPTPSTVIKARMLRMNIRGRKMANTIISR